MRTEARNLFVSTLAQQHIWTCSGASSALLQLRGKWYIVGELPADVEALQKLLFLFRFNITGLKIRNFLK